MSKEGGLPNAARAAFLPDSVATVAKSTFDWDFKYDAGGGPTPIGSTGSHVLYSVLASPVAPQAIPWVDTLDVACTVAQGEATAAGATRAVWDAFYNDAGGLYDTVDGAPGYTGSTTASFNLTLWLSNLEAGSIGVVNCYDMGKAVVVFANALGAGAEYVYASPFGYLNLVHPIGRGWTNNPFYDRVRPKLMRCLKILLQPHAAA